MTGAGGLALLAGLLLLGHVGGSLELSSLLSQGEAVRSYPLYVPLLLSHAGLLRQLEHGREWVALVLLIVMASDSLAYFTGMAFGRHRLYEAISPKKSIEGAFGGLAGGVLGTLAAKLWLLPQLQTADVILLGLGVGAFSQVGDLVESMFKRSFGVKDSGVLFPGHGGLLDRLDSLLAALPVFVVGKAWLGL